MADLRIEVRIQPALVRWGLPVFLLALCGSELGSENVTLSTYYPAPSGVYTQMLTTGNTYLARDSGRVGIGTTSPADKLDVNQGWILRHRGAIQGTGATCGAVSNSTAGIWYADNGDCATVFAGIQDATNGAEKWGVYLSGWELTVKRGGYVGINNTNPKTYLDVNETIATRTESSDCYSEAYYTGSADGCGANEYATMMEGYYSRRVNLSGSIDGSSGSYLCCDCPAGGC